jgi:hypothetical protein
MFCLEDEILERNAKLKTRANVPRQSAKEETTRIQRMRTRGRNNIYCVAVIVNQRKPKKITPIRPSKTGKIIVGLKVVPVVQTQRRHAVTARTAFTVMNDAG